MANKLIEELVLFHIHLAILGVLPQLKFEAVSRTAKHNKATNNLAER